MTQPRIQYARTEDGVNIAYCVLGEGTPLLYASNVWGDLQWYLNDEASRKTVDHLAGAGWRVIRYDGRGSGSSDRSVSDYSLQTRVRDLNAVAGCVEEPQFVLCGYGQGGGAAIAYAVDHPKRVSHLVLVNSFATGAAYYEKIPAMRALIDLRSMAQEQWEFFTITLASAATGFQDAERAKATAKLFRNAMTADAFMAYVDAARKIDVTALLPRLRVNTLVVEDSSGFVTEELSRQLAAAIPNASFVTTEDYTKELHALVFGKELGSRQVTPPAPSGMTAILFLDIAGSTALTSKIGDAAYRERERDLDAHLRTAITGAGGAAVEGKVLGDGIMATFSSARQAIDAARACRDLGDKAGLPLHLGIHAGDVVREGSNVHGGAVQLAARVQSAAAPGEILVSQTVRDLARTSAGVAFEDCGEHDLKGIDEPQRLFAVAEQG